MAVNTTGKCYIFKFVTHFDLRGTTSASSIKYIKGIVQSFIKLWTEVSDLQLDKMHVILNWKIEVSVKNLIQLYKISFMYFILLAWRWPSEVETTCEINHKTLTICVDGSLFVLLLCITQWNDKHKNHISNIRIHRSCTVWYGLLVC
jgi:hypothetical protein